MVVGSRLLGPEALRDVGLHWVKLQSRFSALHCLFHRSSPSRASRQGPVCGFFSAAHPRSLMNSGDLGPSRKEQSAFAGGWGVESQKQRHSESDPMAELSGGTFAVTGYSSTSEWAKDLRSVCECVCVCVCACMYVCMHCTFSKRQIV